jgi:hypothetical protein
MSSQGNKGETTFQKKNKRKNIRIHQRCVRTAEKHGEKERLYRKM